MAPRKKLKDVTVRMYRPGLGDCFLLTFHANSGKSFSLLIDCGVLQGSQGAADRMRLIAGDLQRTTGSHLDAVIATHEHWDHISGFTYGKNTFFGPDDSGQPAPRVAVDRVWLAWTENPDDPDVKRILAKQKKISLAITKAALAMDPVQRQRLSGLLEFSGIFSPEGEALAAAETTGGGKLLNAIMSDIRGWAGKPPRYLQPDDVIDDLADFGVRIYVLAPSRQLRQFTGVKPPGSEKGFNRLNVNQNTAFLAAVLNAASRTSGFSLADGEEDGLSQSDLAELTRLSQPFDDSQAIALEKVPTQSYYNDFYRDHYGFGPEPEQAPAWRRIDTDWLNMAEPLALQQVSNVNNTSLVLAIELVETGKVLLLAGDAEEESWDSWECSHKSLEDLLGRTVLYKVAHHGSVNATVIDAQPGKASLKMMTSPELVVMIPVDMARAAEKEWEFPEKGLLEALETQSKHRVILNCEQSCRDCDPTYLTSKFGRGRIKQDPSTDKLWVEYRIR